MFSNNGRLKQRQGLDLGGYGGTGYQALRQTEADLKFMKPRILIFTGYTGALALLCMHGMRQ